MGDASPKRCKKCNTTHNGGHVCKVKPKKRKKLRNTRWKDLPGKFSIVSVGGGYGGRGGSDLPGEVINENAPLLKKLAEGTKHDAGKPDMTLLPRAGKEEIAKAFMYGQKLYGRKNYLKGMEWTRLLAAAERHVTAFNDGEDFADDSKVHHLGHAGACIMMLLEYYTKKIGTDNRKT